jgi:hypothetical protein
MDAYQKGADHLDLSLASINDKQKKNRILDVHIELCPRHRQTRQHAVYKACPCFVQDARRAKKHITV